MFLNFFLKILVQAFRLLLGVFSAWTFVLNTNKSKKTGCFL